MMIKPIDNYVITEKSPVTEKEVDLHVLAMEIADPSFRGARDLELVENCLLDHTKEDIRSATRCRLPNLFTGTLGNKVITDLHIDQLWGFLTVRAPKKITLIFSTPTLMQFVADNHPESWRATIKNQLPVN
ncbi:MAG: hypothetical protein AAF223_03565 [Bacteroidota bacterium]